MALQVLEACGRCWQIYIRAFEACVSGRHVPGAEKGTEECTERRAQHFKSLEVSIWWLPAS